MASSADHLPRLRSIVAKAPTGPGIYRWLDAKGDVLYVGKAKNLRNRLKSYVLPAKDPALGPWKQALIGKIADLEYTVTGSELEALVLETNLIKELKPKYNVMMKDDKNYVYVRISMQDAFPSVTVVRRMEDDKAKYFGPFLQAWRIRDLLEALHIVFPYRTSKETLERLNRRAENGEDTTSPLYPAPPLEVQIGRHCGLGCGTYTQKQYMAALQELIRFFRGDHVRAVRDLRDAMAQAATGKQFERAAQIRDALQLITEIEKETQIVSDTSGANTDVIAVALLKERAQVALLRERGGKLIGDMNFSLAGHAGDASEVLAQFIPQYYATVTDLPQTILVAALPEDASVLETWLTERRGAKVELAVPERGKKAQLLALAARNAEAQIEQQLAKWEAVARQVEGALNTLKDLLKLSEPPARIEGYDISHLGGTETVGSMVVMQKGKIANDQYRSFTIRTLHEGQIDDYAALREVLKRRFKHLTHDRKREEVEWEKQGITVGRPRKAEAESIAALIGAVPKGTEVADLVARKDDRVIGVLRALLHGGSTVEMLLPVLASGIDPKLGVFMLRKTLAGAKKEKLYIAVLERQQEEFAEYGFRHVLAPPKALLPKVQPGILVLVSLPSERKIDLSLTARPDLIVIDGGKGQLSAGLEALKESKLDLRIISLAKREEEVFVPGQPIPVLFPSDSPAKFLLMRLRDEAHRFANRHREQRGTKHSMQSSLDSIPGIGDQTKNTLLKAFGSVARIREASDSDLRAYISETQLKELRERL
jgi:excinuclease ABC subunit C